MGWEELAVERLQRALGQRCPNGRLLKPQLNALAHFQQHKVVIDFFHKTHKLVLSLSIAVSLVALALSIASGNWWWFAIAMLMHLNGPYTLKCMMPLNHRLMSDDLDVESEGAASDLKKWGKLHGVRTIWNLLIFAALIVLCLWDWAVS